MNLPVGKGPVIQKVDPEVELPIKKLAEVEIEYIRQVLAQLGGNKKKTAEALGISLKTLYNKLNGY